MSRRRNAWPAPWIAPWIDVGFDAWKLGLEAATVVGQRSLLLAMAGPGSEVEARRMIAEKIDAGLALQSLAWRGGLGFTPAGAAARTVAHYRRRVRANQRRLARPSA